jgi:hypothetical protein
MALRIDDIFGRRLDEDKAYQWTLNEAEILVAIKSVRTLWKNFDDDDYIILIKILSSHYMHWRGLYVF